MVSNQAIVSNAPIGAGPPLKINAESELPLREIAPRGYPNGRKAVHRPDMKLDEEDESGGSTMHACMGAIVVPVENFTL